MRHNGHDAICALEMTDAHARSPDQLGEPLGERPGLARGAAEQIEAERSVLGKGVHREMRLREEEHPGNPAGRREDVPLPRPDGSQPELVDHPIEQRDEGGAIGEALGVASERLDDPFVTTRDGVERGHPCAAPHSEQNFAARGIPFPQLMQNLVPSAAGGPASGTAVDAAGEDFSAGLPPDET